ncbi:MAG TPA: hypothetical protein VID70_07350 [Solirubrobacteraceae bacterium]
MRKLVFAGLLAALAATTGAVAASARPLGKIFVNSGESIRCPAGGEACTAKLQATGRDAHNRDVTLGHTTITIAPAATAKLIFKLDRTAKHLLLTRGPLQARLTVTIRTGTQAPIVSSHPITIGVPKRHGRRR